MVKESAAESQETWIGEVPWRREWQHDLEFSYLKNPKDREAWHFPEVPKEVGTTNKSILYLLNLCQRQGWVLEK